MVDANSNHQYFWFDWEHGKFTRNGQPAIGSHISSIGCHWGGIGATMAKKVEMTKCQNWLLSCTRWLVSCCIYRNRSCHEPHALNITEKGMQIPAGNRLELFLGAAIGAITFSGSVIAFGKLSGNINFVYFKERRLFF